MADFTDVENVLATMVGAIVYPNGTSQPSIANCGVRIFRGWPSGTQIDADMKAGNVLVSIYSQMGIERVTTRYPTEGKVSKAPVTTVTVQTTDNTVTFGGTINGPQYATVVIDAPANAYTYPIQQTDTLATIAQNLAAIIPAQFAAGSSGQVLTIGAGRVLAARVGAAGTLLREVKRQLRAFRLNVWAPSEALRTAIAAPIDAALGIVDRIALPDGSGGRLLYQNSIETDSGELTKVYERHLIYTVDFPTTVADDGFAVTAPNVSVTPQPITP